MTQLSSEQQVLVEKLKTEVGDIVKAHTCLRQFCNEHCYVRYLRARSWDLKKAVKMLKGTLEWRLTYKPHLIRWEEVEPEALTGKQMIYPVPDKEGRPVVLMRSRNENTKNEDNKIKFLIYHLEMASRQADATGVGKMTWLIDFEGYAMRNAPAIKTSLSCLHILQNHYPERLACAICFHAPSLFSLTYKAVSPFIDPVTANKIHFINNNSKDKEHMAERFDMSKMENCLGGDIDGSVFKLEEYAQFCRQMDAALEAEFQAIEAGHSSMTQTCSDSVVSLTEAANKVAHQAKQSST